jgi:hypothetical protein
MFAKDHIFSVYEADVLKKIFWRKYMRHLLLPLAHLTAQSVRTVIVNQEYVNSKEMNCFIHSVFGMTYQSTDQIKFV